MPQIIPIEELKNISETSECERGHRLMKLYAAVEESEEQIAQGKGGDAWEGLAALRKKYDI